MLILNQFILTSLRFKILNYQIDNKYSSDQTFAETKYFEIILYATLLIVRTLLPRRQDWNLRMSIDLILHDTIYMTDSLEFSKILFENKLWSEESKSTSKNLVLWTLAYTSCFFCLNTIYRPSQVHIKYVYYKLLSKFEQIELRLSYDPFIRFIVPSLFYDIPMVLVRVIIFYGNTKSISWENFIFLLKNITGLLLTMLAYFEIKSIENVCVFYPSSQNMI